MQDFLRPLSYETFQLEFMINEILDDRQLADQWQLVGTSDAIAKRFQSPRALPKANPRHLRPFKMAIKRVIEK